MAVPTYVTHVGFGHTVDEKAYAITGHPSGYTLVSGTPNYIETTSSSAPQFLTSRQVNIANQQVVNNAQDTDPETGELDERTRMGA